MPWAVGRAMHVDAHRFEDHFHVFVHAVRHWFHKRFHEQLLLQCELAQAAASPDVMNEKVMHFRIPEGVLHGCTPQCTRSRPLRLGFGLLVHLSKVVGHHSPVGSFSFSAPTNTRQ